MMYITDVSESLSDLKTKEGYEGSLESYAKDFAAANPEFCSKYPNYKYKLPAFTPVNLVTFDQVDADTRKETYFELIRFSLEERKNLRKMQEDGNTDIEHHLALSDMMEDLQQHAQGFRQALKTPLILTPWDPINASLTNKSLVKIFSESTTKTSTMISLSAHYKEMDLLYETMLKREALAREYLRVSTMTDKASKALKKSLQAELDKCTKTIRQLLPKKLDTKVSKYLSRKYKKSEIMQMRQYVETRRQAGKLKLRAINLDFLNRSGWGRLRSMVSEMKMLGDGVTKFGKMLNWGVVAYDTAEAYATGKNVARTFLASSASLIVATEVTTAVGGTTALGGMVIGAIAGDAAAGATLLICSPVVGWVIVLVAGVTAAGFIAYKTKQATEGIWDFAEEACRPVMKEAVKAVDWMHGYFKAGWEKGAGWFSSFYGDDNPNATSNRQVSAGG